MKLETRTLLGGGLSIVVLVVMLLGLGRAVISPVLDRRIEERLDDAHALHAQLLRGRLESLGLIADLVARDPFVAAQLSALAAPEPVPESGPPPGARFLDDPLEPEPERVALDLDALGDLLEQRRDEASLDAILIADAAGEVLVSRGDFQVEPPLTQIPLVSMTLERTRVTGLVQANGRLFAASARTLERDFDPYGYLLVGSAVGDRFARQVADALPDDIAFLALGPAGVTLAGSSLPEELAVALPNELRKLGPVNLLLDGLGRDLDLEGERWRVLPVPLRDTEDEPIGVVLALVSRSAIAAPFGRLAAVTVLAGLVSLLLFALAARWAAGAVRRDLSLVSASLAAARQGDLAGRIASRTGDSFREIGQDLDRLLGSVQSERALSQMAERVSRSMNEPLLAGRAESPSSSERILILVENRSVAGARSASEPVRSLRKLERDLQSARAVTLRRGGRIEGALGHRLLVSFESAAADIAVGLAARLVRDMSIADSAFDEVEAGCAAVTLGPVASGTLPVHGAPEPVAVGLVLRRLDSLLREAGAGEVVLSRDLHSRVASELDVAGVTVREQRGILVPQPLFVLDAESAVVLDGGLRGLEEAEADGEVALGLDGIDSGTVLGERFELRERLGVGRAGPLYKALDRELGDWVALRLLEGGHSHRERLVPALQALGGVRHSGLAKVIDSGMSGEIAWVSREFVRGVSLATAFDSGARLGANEVRALAQQSCAALAALHGVGQVHGALCARDVLASSSGALKITDAGMAGQHTSFDDPQRARLSPEQRSGARPDERSDVWALGVLLYQALVGRYPFEDPEHPVATQPSLAWSGISPQLERVLDACLDPSPNKRFASASQLWEAWAGAESGT